MEICPNKSTGTPSLQSSGYFEAQQHGYCSADHLSHSLSLVEIGSSCSGNESHDGREGRHDPLQEDKGKALCEGPGVTSESANAPAVDNDWICAICREAIPLVELAQIKDCEHAYCAKCILTWASYKDTPWCPQCRVPFSSLFSYRTLNGEMRDYMVEEAVCLLLRAPWFEVDQEMVKNRFRGWPEDPLPEEFLHDYDPYEEHDYEDEDGDYLNSSQVRLGNRPWGDNGYVRRGRLVARPAPGGGHAGASRGKKGKASGESSSGAAPSSQPIKQPLGRRAKRAQKRQDMDGY